MRVNSLLVRLERRLRKWLLPPLVRTIFPEPVTRKRFAVALWVLSLYFFTFFFFATTGLLHKNTAELQYPRMIC